MSAAKAKDGGSRRWWALILLCVAQFVDVLDINAVIVALPTIGRELGFSHGDLQWVVTSYVLLFGGFLLLAGRLADLFGRRKMFAVGLALFAASSLLCGYAWSPLVLVVFRAAQGLGAAIVAPAALSIISTTFPEGRERNFAMGLWTAVAAGGGAAGLVLGGLITDVLGWEWIFFVNVPLGAAGVALTFVLLDERWHIGFGLRCLIEAQPSPDLLDDLLARAEDAAAAWGDAVPPATRERVAHMCAHRLSATGLIERHVAA